MQFPERIGPNKVVAFVHVGQAPGTRPGQGIAITEDRADRYNVHSVWLADPEANRWEGQNGRYGVTWYRALDLMNERARQSLAPTAVSSEKPA